MFVMTYYDIQWILKQLTALLSLYSLSIDGLHICWWFFIFSKDFNVVYICLAVFPCPFSPSSFWISNVLYATMQMSTSRQFSQIIFGSTLFKANWWWISNDAPLLRLSSHQMLNVACVPVFLMLCVTNLEVWCRLFRQRHSVEVTEQSLPARHSFYL